MRYLLKVWPITNAAKEVLFLQELEEIFEISNPVTLKTVHKQLFTRLCSSCITSNHLQVAERSLIMLNNDHIMKMISENKSELLPIVIKGLLKNQEHHWSQTVQSLTFNVKKVFSELDA